MLFYVNVRKESQGFFFQTVLIGILASQHSGSNVLHSYKSKTNQNTTHNIWVTWLRGVLFPWAQFHLHILCCKVSFPHEPNVGAVTIINCHEFNCKIRPFIRQLALSEDQSWQGQIIILSYHVRQFIVSFPARFYLKWVFNLKCKLIPFLKGNISYGSGNVY